MTGKEVGDVWAVSMQASVTAVLSRVRTVTAMVKLTENLPTTDFRKVCHEVMMSPMPPNGSSVEAGICMITKVYAPLSLIFTLIAL